MKILIICTGNTCRSQMAAHCIAAYRGAAAPAIVSFPFSMLDVTIESIPTRHERPGPDKLTASLKGLRERGIKSLAVVLMHSYMNKVIMITYFCCFISLLLAYSVPIEQYRKYFCKGMWYRTTKCIYKLGYLVYIFL